MDIAFDMGLRLQGHAQAADGPNDLPADDDIFGDDRAVDLGLIAQQQRTALDVAKNLSVDLNLAL